MTNPFDSISDQDFHAALRSECEALANLLVEKNIHYGNSILRSPNVFSRTTPLEKVQDRLDDKLSRLLSQGDDPEDTKLDLIGYMVIERVLMRIAGNLGREVLSKAPQVISVPTVETTPEPVVEKPKATRKPRAKKVAAPEPVVEEKRAVQALDEMDAGRALGENVTDFDKSADDLVSESSPESATLDEPTVRATSDELPKVSAADLLGGPATSETAAPAPVAAASSVLDLL